MEILELMTDTNLLLRAYYEALYELLQANKELLITKVEQLLTKEIEKADLRILITRNMQHT